MANSASALNPVTDGNSGHPQSMDELWSELRKGLCRWDGPIPEDSEALGTLDKLGG